MKISVLRRTITQNDEVCTLMIIWLPINYYAPLSLVYTRRIRCWTGSQPCSIDPTMPVARCPLTLPFQLWRCKTGNNTQGSSPISPPSNHRYNMCSIIIALGCQPVGPCEQQTSSRENPQLDLPCTCKLTYINTHSLRETGALSLRPILFLCWLPS